MKAIFNNEFLDRKDIKLNPNNRGFKYGDGIFETVASKNLKPRFLEKHLTRLKTGAKILHLEMPEALNFNNIYAKIKTLQTENEIDRFAKIKIYLWRNAEGLYTPKGSHADFLITAENHYDAAPPLADNVGISEKVTNYPTETSRLKTMNALQYVIAGIEKEERKLDEIIIRDYRGFISETLTSNIFIKKNGVYLTPPLITGCIEGIMRNTLIDLLREKGYEVREELFTEKELSGAESAFTSNALGFRFFWKFGRTNFIADNVIQDIIDSISNSKEQ